MPQDVVGVAGLATDDGLGDDGDDVLSPGVVAGFEEADDDVLVPGDILVPGLTTLVEAAGFEPDE